MQLKNFPKLFAFNKICKKQTLKHNKFLAIAKTRKVGQSYS